MTGDLPARIEALLEELAEDPRTAARVDRLVQLLSELYGTGLQRLVDCLMDDQPGRDRLTQASTDDELLLSLLVLHDLHPVSAWDRANAALDRVRPHLGSHAGGVALLGLDDGVAHLALEGSCDGCPASSVTVRTAIEGAILAAVPEVTEVVVDGEVAAPPAGLLRISRVGEYAPEDCPV